MTRLRRLAYAALGFAFLHVVFGAVVRITGSGMGCGDHWPKCYGRWFPPLDQPTLVIEWSHRLLASLLVGLTVALVAVAWSRRREPGVSGAGGPLRAAALALAVVLVTAGLGAVTVFYGNPAWATVVHKVLAAALLGALVATIVRAGGLGAGETAAATGTRKAAGGATAAAGLALAVIALGALTAKVPDAAVACRGFPLCGEGSLGGGAQHLQLTHRVLAYLLVLHLASLPFVFRRRGEPGPVTRAAWAAAGLGLLQVVWAGWMVTGGFPAVVRSLHQATGMAIWVAAFAMTYLARRGLGSGVPGLARHTPDPRPRTLAAEGRP